MKKYLFLLLKLFLICAFTAGCADTPQTAADNRELQGIANTNTIEANQSVNGIDIREFREISISSGNIDLDLTVLSDTISHAAVSDLMTNPEDNIDKTIKLRGSYNVWYSESTALNYHFIAIEGSPGCCQQGIEFILLGDYIYPNDYPETDTEIEVIGTFTSYREFEGTYYYLAVDNLTILE